MIKNNYEKPKKQNIKEKNISGFEQLKFQAINCTTQAKESQNNSIKNQGRGQPGG